MKITLKIGLISPDITLQASREASPIRISERSQRYRNETDYTNGNINGHLHNGHITTAEPSDDDEYIDTVEVNMFEI